MPSGHLNERKVQHVAVNWLADYYKQRLDAKAIVSATEKWVSKHSDYGSGRADGLIVAKLQDDTIYTVSLEAKSSRTRHNIMIGYRDVKWLTHAFLVGLIPTLLGVYVGNQQGGGWFWGLGFPVLVLILAMFVFAVFTYGSQRYQPIDVVKQVKRYPANERWIVLSTDVFKKVQTEKQDSDFEYICQREGIGLLRVSNSNHVKIVVPAQKKRTPKKLDCFLSCYAKEKQLRAELESAISEGILVAEPVELDEVGEVIQEIEVSLEEAN